MNGRRCSVLFLLSVSGCSAVDLQPVFDRVHTDVTERTSIEIERGVEAEGHEAVGRLVAAKLARELSSDDAVAVSLLKNTRLRALYRDLGVAQSDVVAAGLPENPVFSVERRFAGKAAEFDVAQEFVSLFLIPLRRRLSERELDRERLRVTHEIVEHTAKVRDAYFRAQAAEQLAELRRTVMQALVGALEAAKALRAAGNNSVWDVAIAERGANRARLAVADAELEVATTRERLNVLLGLFGEETRWRIPQRLPDLPAPDVELSELERQAVTDRFDLASQRAEIEALAQAAGITQITSVLPELSIGGHIEREPQGDSTFGPSVDFPLSLFSRGRAARARAEQKLLGAIDSYAALAIEIRSEVRVAFAKLETARKKATFYQTAVLPTEQTVTRETQLRYNGMFVGVFQLLEARQEQVESAREFIETLCEYWQARTELERVLARRLTSRIAPPQAGEAQAVQPTAHHHHK